MKTKCILILSLMALTSGTFAGPLRELIKQRIAKKMEERPAPGARTDIDKTITSSGTFTFKISDRYYMLHVPAGYSPKNRYPVLFALHGGGGNMKIQATDEYYKQISKSDKEGFIAVFPNGYSKFKSGEFATWNAGNCCGDARDKNIDDVGFIKDILKALHKQVSVDDSRIFATGMSNGGMMTYRLACEMADTFKAVAIVAGTDNTNHCSPSKPISILHIHAKDDDHVLYHGGAGEGLRDITKVTHFTSVPDTIKKWVKLNGCSEIAKRVFDVKGAFCDLYSGCKSGTEVKLCVTESGAHSWPGGEKPRGNGDPSKAISANDMMWDFFNPVR